LQSFLPTQQALPSLAAPAEPVDAAEPLGFAPLAAADADAAPPAPLSHAENARSEVAAERQRRRSVVMSSWSPRLPPASRAPSTMTTSFACLLYPRNAVSDRALSRGFAVALAGAQVAEPRLLVAALPGVDGYDVAFYSSGDKLPPYEELDHACDLFEEDLSPGLCVREASGADDAAIYSVVYSDDVVVDDAIRFGPEGVERRFAREGDDGLEVGRATFEDETVAPLKVDGEASDEEISAALKPHRGTTFVSERLGVAIVPALVRALFEADRRVRVNLVDPSAEAIVLETRNLNRTLARVDGRAAFPMPRCGAADAPASVAAFAKTYDWADPSDPSDLYRELSLGRVEGTLHFMRAEEIVRAAEDSRWAKALGKGCYPLATLASSALGGGRGAPRIVGIDARGENLVVTTDKGVGFEPAGPTLGELIAYLALGFRKRDDVEEDLIGALMLRAVVRTRTA
jgi:hypothetical protein